MNVNIPNILTFSRIVAAPVVSVLMFMPPPLGNWVPFAVYAFACFLGNRHCFSKEWQN